MSLNLYDWDFTLSGNEYTAPELRTLICTGVCPAHPTKNNKRVAFPVRDINLVDDGWIITSNSRNYLIQPEDVNDEFVNYMASIGHDMYSYVAVLMQKMPQ